MLVGSTVAWDRMAGAAARLASGHSCSRSHLPPAADGALEKAVSQQGWGLVLLQLCSPSVLGFRGPPPQAPWPHGTEALAVGWGRRGLRALRAPRALTVPLKGDKAIPIPGMFLTINPSQALRD